MGHEVGRHVCSKNVQTSFYEWKKIYAVYARHLRWLIQIAGKRVALQPRVLAGEEILPPGTSSFIHQGECLENVLRAAQNIVSLYVCSSLLSHTEISYSLRINNS